MIEYYLQIINQACSSKIAAEIRMIEMTNGNGEQAASRILQELSDTNNTACLEGYVGYFASRLSSGTTEAIIAELFDAAMSIPPDSRHALRQAMENAYKYIQITDTNHKDYFTVAALYRLELTQDVETQFATPNFSGHTDAGMSYYSYLILIGEQKGIQGFNVMLSEHSKNIEIIFALVSGLCDLTILLAREGGDTTALSSVLRRYENDSRRTVGVNGPGTGAAPQDIVGPVLKAVGQ